MARGYRIAVAAICFALSLLIVFREGTHSVSPIECAWFIVWFSLPLFSRRWSWNLYCFSLAFLIDQWGTLHGYLLAISTLSLLSGDLLRTEGAQGSDEKKRGILGFLTLFSAVSAVWNLVLDLPLLRGFYWGAGNSITALLPLITLLPTDRGYQFIASFQLMAACLLSYRLATHIRSSDLVRAELIRWLFWGLSVIVLLGSLEFMTLISLDSLRHTNPYVQLSDMHRFLSLSGHPGWFALYASLLAPLIYWYLTSDKRTWPTIEWALFVMTLIAIVMTLQIGAWIALAGLVFWLGIRQREPPADENENTPHRVPPFVLFIMMTSGVVSVLFIMVRVFFRFEGSILITAKVRHRLLLWFQGYEMWLDNPLTGSGIGSFGFEYSTRFPHWVVDFVQFHSSAHSTSLQSLVEQGIPGFFVMLIIPLAYILRGSILIRRRVVEKKSLYGCTVACMIIFLLFSLTQHFFYIPAVLMVFWLFVGLAIDAGPEKTGRPIGPGGRRRMIGSSLAVAGGIAFCLLLLTVIQNHFWGPRFDGLYQLETTVDGSQHYRWSAWSSTIDIPPDATIVDLEVLIVDAIREDQSVNVSIALNGRELKRFVIADARPRSFSIPLSKKSGRRLTISTDRVVCPWLKEMSTDRRILGVCVVRLSFNGRDNHWNTQAERLKKQSQGEGGTFFKTLNDFMSSGKQLVP